MACESSGGCVNISVVQGKYSVTLFLTESIVTLLACLQDMSLHAVIMHTCSPKTYDLVGLMFAKKQATLSQTHFFPRVHYNLVFHPRNSCDT